MSYKTDPRLGVADEYAHALATLLMDEREFLRLLDAADRAAGIVRVDTRDEALVERLAPMLHPNGQYSAERWAGLSDEWREFGREVARAVLAALTAAAGGDDDPSSPHSPARLSDPLRKYHEPHAPCDNCGPACNHEGYEAAGGDQ